MDGFYLKVESQCAFFTIRRIEMRVTLQETRISSSLNFRCIPLSFYGPSFFRKGGVSTASGATFFQRPFGHWELPGACSCVGSLSILRGGDAPGANRHSIFTGGLVLRHHASRHSKYHSEYHTHKCLKLGYDVIRQKYVARTLSQV